MRDNNSKAYQNGVSIVLSTYNGEKYLIEQLDSLRNQTMKADEVIISDDASTDETTNMVQDYISNYNLENWILLKNTTNRGWKINFKETLKLAKHKYVFPCDQDDIWELDKIEKMVKVMDSNPKIMLLASNYRSFGSCRYDEIKIDNNGGIRRAEFSKDFLTVKRPGCVFCVNKVLIDFIDTYACKEYPHDAFLWRMACLLDGLYFYHQITINYRRHPETATGREKKSKKNKLETLEYYEMVLDVAGKCLRDLRPEDLDKDKSIKKFRRWVELRKELLSTGRLVDWIRLLGYQECYYSTKMFFGDLYFAKKKES